MLDLDKMSKKFDEILESPETEAYFNRLKIKEDIQDGRFVKFETYLQTHSFDELLKRVMDEHNEAYRDKCFKKGCEDYPTNKMQFIYDYVSNSVSHIEVAGITDGHFHTECRFFKGYYFTITHGQGCFYRIYDSNKKDICTI
jgi:glutamate synthase domain-containing protein 2